MAGQTEELIRTRIDELVEGQRLDIYLTQGAPRFSRARVQKLIEGGWVRVNGQLEKARYKVKAGDEVVVLAPDPEPLHMAPVALVLDILYEDDQIIVINKPAGLAVHPGAGDPGPTLVHGLIHHVGGVAGLSGLQNRPGIVHRLDKDTTGVMVCAKSDEAHRHLARQFHDKTNLREYLALLDGAMGVPLMDHESYLHRDPHSRIRFASMTRDVYDDLVQKRGGEPKGVRFARTVFKRERLFRDRLTLARVRLFTGRTHQIRVHAKDIGLPIVGDLVYHRPVQLPHTFGETVRREMERVRRQMLHAAVLGFIHPSSARPMRFEAPLPTDFAGIMVALEQEEQA